MGMSKRTTLLIGGIFLIVFGIYKIASTAVFRTSLIPIEGPVRNVSNQIHTYKSTSRYGTEQTNIMSKITIHLDGQQQEFCLSQGIASYSENTEFLKMTEAIKTSKKLTLWIDKDEKNLFQPKVYEIIKNDKISLLKFESVRGENFFLSIALTCMGLAFVAIAILTNKFRKH